MTEDYAPSPLIVLGMHRSGTSALAGTLRLCGVWLGDSTDLTTASPENHKGFWERRDIRQICDTLLHSAAADWWKVANFDLSAIPHSVIHEQKRKLQAVIAELNQHPTWAIKEPRLCLVLPLLLDSLRNPVCIHVVRNPLEVAQSLRARNGFPISWGLALWEAYNIHALRASHSLPRVFVSYNSLLRAPVDTLTGLIRQLAALCASPIALPPNPLISGFVDPALYRHIVTQEETQERLSPFQSALWKSLLSGNISALAMPLRLPNATKRHLFDLESTEMSLLHHKTKTADYKEVLRKRDAALEYRDEQISTLNTKLQELRAVLEARETSFKQKDREIKQKGHEIQTLTSAVKVRDQRLSRMRRSISWRVTAPLRTISKLLTKPNTNSPTQSTHSPEPPAPRSHSFYSSSLDSHSPVAARPITTYIVPTTWWHRHPAGARTIEDSGQYVLLLGIGEQQSNYGITCIEGPYARSLALAAVVTPTAIEVSSDAEPTAVDWRHWKEAAENNEERQDGSTRLLTAASIQSHCTTRHD